MPAVRECTECGSSREVPASLGQPKGPCGGLPKVEEATSRQSSSIQQLQQETASWQTQVQRQASLLEPQDKDVQACQETENQELRTTRVLVSMMQQHVAVLRAKNRERLDQLQQRERAMEQMLQELAFMKRQYQTMERKDAAVQTEVTSYTATHSHAAVSCNILTEEHTEPVKQVQYMAALQAQLAQAQQENAKLEEKMAAYKEERQQLHWELRKLQGSWEQSKQEAQALQKRLQELSSRAQHWHQLYQDSERALAMREAELVICKVELAFFKEQLSKAKEQVETLRSSHTLACSNNSRLHRKELLLVNISQYEKQIQGKEEPGGHRIQRKVTELISREEYLQDTQCRMQEEKTYFASRTHEEHHRHGEPKGNSLGPILQGCPYPTLSSKTRCDSKHIKDWTANL